MGNPPTFWNNASDRRFHLDVRKTSMSWFSEAYFAISHLLAWEAPGRHQQVPSFLSTHTFGLKDCNGVHLLFLFFWFVVKEAVSFLALSKCKYDLRRRPT